MSILGTLASSMGDQFIGQLTKSLGTGSSSKTKGLVDMALPLLLGALKKNTDNDGGAGVLHAVEKKHNGGLLDNVSGFLENPDLNEGTKILGHLFGKEENNAEELLASQAGSSKTESGNILKILAPMVMGAIGKNLGNKGGIDLGSLVSMISSDAKESDKKSPLSSSLLTAFLDKNNDGSVLDDLAGMAVKKFL